MPIRTVHSNEDIRSTFKLMKQLRPHLEADEYVDRIKRLQSEYGYRLLVVFEGEEARAAAGFKINDTLAWGKFLYIDDLITDEASRSRGYAKQLFDWLEEESANLQCAGVHLDSGVHRHDAHRFYLNRKMRISGYHFEKS